VRQIDDGMNDLAQPNGQSSGSAAPPRNNLNPRQQLIARRSTHQAELERLDEEIVTLQNLRKERAQEIADLTQQIVALDETVVAGRSANAVRNYYDKFEWSNGLKEQMKRVFGIEEFRLAQEGCVIYRFVLPARMREDEQLMKTAFATRTWTDEISFVSCQLVSRGSFQFHRRCIDHYMHRLQEEGNRSRINYLQRSCLDARS
jgi:hypothetical protein